jgi:hypothetical protein
LGPTGPTGASGALALVVRETPTGNVDGSNKDFELANNVVQYSESVYLNGLLQDVGGANDYTISGKIISFVDSPLVGDKIRVTYLKS